MQLVRDERDGLRESRDILLEIQLSDPKQLGLNVPRLNRLTEKVEFRESMPLTVGPKARLGCSDPGAPEGLPQELVRKIMCEFNGGKFCAKLYRKYIEDPAVRKAVDARFEVKTDQKHVYDCIEEVSSDYSILDTATPFKKPLEFDAPEWIKSVELRKAQPLFSSRFSHDMRRLGRSLFAPGALEGYEEDLEDPLEAKSELSGWFDEANFNEFFMEEYEPEFPPNAVYYANTQKARDFTRSY